MSPPSDDELRREARAAWEHEARRRALPPAPSLVLLAIVAAVGAFSAIAVALRVSLPFEGRAPAVAVTSALGIALAALLVLAPLGLVVRARRRARELVARAKEERAGARCPRCDAPLTAGAPDGAGRRDCGACGATLLEAEGLLVAHTSDAFFRVRRFRASARARLAAGRPPVALSPSLWIANTAAALGLLWATAAMLGGAPPSIVEAPLGLDRQVSLHGTARASSEAPAPPAGAATRPNAPAWMGTLVLARRPPGPYHELAVIVRVEPPRAFVVYANGASRWVRARDLLAPELAPGDALELAEGAGYVPVELVERIGEALRVRRADGTTQWTSAALVRVRSDAPHRTGEGLDPSVPPGAWVEARVAGVRRPALQVGVSEDGQRAYLAFSDGSARWVGREDVEAQTIGPGVRVFVDGARTPMIVASRIGHALSVVGPDGERSWTALSRVRREVP